MIDENYDAHERVQHRHISAEKPSNRHRDKQPMHHKILPPQFLLYRESNSARLMPAPFATCGVKQLAE